MIFRACIVLVFLVFIPVTVRAATADDCTFLREGATFRYGAEYTGVLSLQKLLNRDTDTVVAVSGVGSPGNETYFYGPATIAALKKFQTKYKDEILYPQQLTEASGFLGRSTRAKLLRLYCDQVNQSTATTTDTTMMKTMPAQRKSPVIPRPQPTPSIKKPIAPITELPPVAMPPTDTHVRGVCGRATSYVGIPQDNFCSSGTLSSLSTTPQSTTWRCEGTGKGASVSCSTRPIDRLSFSEYNDGVTIEALQRSRAQNGGLHDAVPHGVPLSYDWAERSVIHAATNIPQGFTSIIPWGVIYKESGQETTSARVSFRNTRLFLCDARTQTWSLLREGSIDGAVFEPDFSGNVATSATRFERKGRQASVVFPTEKAFHFWTERQLIGTDRLCGIIVLAEAKQDTREKEVANPLLFAVSADYWLSQSAVWDNYATNVGIGFGNFRYLTPSWRWYSFVIADDENLKRLESEGFLMR